jgi:hypothetical protein
MEDWWLGDRLGFFLGGLNWWIEWRLYPSKKFRPKKAEKTQIEPKIWPNYETLGSKLRWLSGFLQPGSTFPWSECEKAQLRLNFELGNWTEKQAQLSEIFCSGGPPGATGAPIVCEKILGFKIAQLFLEKWDQNEAFLAKIWKNLENLSRNLKLKIWLE